MANVQSPTLIEDVPGFVRKVTEVQDPYRIDDNLEELKYVAFAVLANRMVKFSGLFPTKDLAVERAKKVAMDGAFTTAVGQVGKWGVFGRGMDTMRVDDAVRLFAQVVNTETAQFEKRLKEAAKPSSSSTELQQEDPAEPVQAEDPGVEVDQAVLRRIKLAVARGDVKSDRMLDQRFLVIAHGRMSDDSCLFRVVGSYENEEEATRAAKKAFDADGTDRVTQRFDYAVARQFVWLNFPIDFAKDVQDTRVDSNPHLQEYYKGEMYKRSDEYKAALVDVEETTREMRAAAAKREIKSAPLAHGE